MTPQERAAAALFEEIKHGDEAHQAWLREKLFASPVFTATRRAALLEAVQVAESSWSYMGVLSKLKALAQQG